MHRRWDTDESARMEAWVREIYGDFVGKVGECRQLTPEAVDAVAQGRVFLGSQVGRPAAA